MRPLRKDPACKGSRSLYWMRPRCQQDCQRLAGAAAYRTPLQGLQMSLRLLSMPVEDIEDKFEPQLKTRRKTVQIGRNAKSDHFRRKSCLHKKRFGSMDEAKYSRHHIFAAIRKSGKEPDDLRIYGCPFCRGYHFTSILGHGENAEQRDQDQVRGDGADLA